MPTIKNEFTVQAPPEGIYAVLSDFSQATSWVTGTKECKQVTPGEFGVGTRAEQLKVQMGRPTRVVVTVERAEKGREIKLLAVPEGRPPASVTWSLSPAPNGGTMVIEVISFELPGLMKLLTPMVKRSVSKEMKQDAASLTKKMEG